MAEQKITLSAFQLTPIRREYNQARYTSKPYRSDLTSA